MIQGYKSYIYKNALQTIIAVSFLMVIPDSCPGKHLAFKEPQVTEGTDIASYEQPVQKGTEMTTAQYFSIATELKTYIYLNNCTEISHKNQNRFSINFMFFVLCSYELANAIDILLNFCCSRNTCNLFMDYLKKDNEK